jgi:hypothetical protein
LDETRGAFSSIDFHITEKYNNNKKTKNIRKMKIKRNNMKEEKKRILKIIFHSQILAGIL